MNKYIYTTVLSAFLLSACSSNGPLVHSVGEYEGSNNQNKGIYLVEEPYEIKGVWYFPAEQYDYSEQGLASWYIPSGAPSFTTNGEVYDANIPTARHKTLPLPSIVKITNLENNKTVIARVNDRGPMVNNRLIDVSQFAAKKLGMPTSGTVMVRVEVLEEESKQAKEQLLTQDLIYQPPQSNKKDAPKATAELALVKPSTMSQEATTLEIKDIENQRPVVIAKAGDTNIALGSFSNAQNAENLRKNLSQRYPAYVEKVNRNGRVLHVVKVGPYPKSQATDVLKQLKSAGYKDAYLVK